MKISTRIKRYVPADMIDGREIILTVDGGKTAEEKADTLEAADAIHARFTAEGYTVLPPCECPVVNSRNEIIMHYTSTTYKEWCEA